MCYISHILTCGCDLVCRIKASIGKAIIDGVTLHLETATFKWNGEANALRGELLGAVSRILRWTPVGSRVIATPKSLDQPNSQKWIKAQLRAVASTALQKQLDAFQQIYNTQRPHRSLQRRTPQPAKIRRARNARLPKAGSELG